MHLAAAVNVRNQVVIETPTWNKPIEPYGNPFVLVKNPAVAGRNLEFYRYDGRGIRGSDEELRRCMARVTVESVFDVINKLILSGAGLQRKARRLCVSSEHFYGIQRQFFQVHPGRLHCLGQNVVRHRHDGAAAIFRLKNVQHFTDAGPEQFRLGQTGQEFFALAHLRHRVNARVRNATGEHGHDCRHFGVQHFGNTGDLLQGENCGNVEFYTFAAPVRGRAAAKIRRACW